MKVVPIFCLLAVCPVGALAAQRALPNRPLPPGDLAPLSGGDSPLEGLETFTGPVGLSVTVVPHTGESDKLESKVNHNSSRQQGHLVVTITPQGVLAHSLLKGKVVHPQILQL